MTATADLHQKRHAGVTALSFAIPINGQSEKGTLRIATRGGVVATDAECTLSTSVGAFSTGNVYSGMTDVYSDIAIDVKSPVTLPVVMVAYCMLQQAQEGASALITIDSIDATWTVGDAAATQPPNTAKATQKQQSKKK